MKIINLTPHDIVICGSCGDKILTLPASGVVARVSSETTIIDYLEIDGFRVPVTKTEFAKVANLPDPVDGVVYLCSSLVQLNSTRTDLISPDTTRLGAVRDNRGRIVGSTGFQRID